MKTKVFMCSVDGVNDLIVAANSLFHASKFMAIPYRHMRLYGHETGNSKDCALALSNPGVICKSKIDHCCDRNWVKVDR